MPYDVPGGFPCSQYLSTHDCASRKAFPMCVYTLMVLSFSTAIEEHTLRVCAPFRIICNTITSNLPWQKLVSAPPPSRFFWAFTIAPHESRPDATKITALSCQPMPTNVLQLRSILGAISCYTRRSDLAKRLRSTHHLLNRTEPFVFSPDIELVIKPILTYLSNPPILVFSD